MAADSSNFILANESVRQNLLREINQLPLGSYQVKIEKVKRSNNQNSLMWKWYATIGEHTGNTPEELHEYMKGLWRRIKGEEYTEIMGRQVLKPITTTKFNKAEMSEFMGYIEQLAIKLQVTLPAADYYGIQNEAHS